MRPLKIIIATGALVALLAPRADAALILAATINGTNVCATDNNSPCSFGTQLPDINAAPGQLNLASVTIAGVLIEGSAQAMLASLQQDLLSSSSLFITNNNSTAIQLMATVSATDFIGPIQFAQATGSGTWVNALGSNTTYTYYDDPTNTQGALTALSRPGTLVSTFTDTASSPLDSFSFNSGQLPVTDPDRFSMTLGFDMLLAPGGQLISRGQSEVKTPIPQQVVPEPASMLLMGTGLAWGAARLRKRRTA